MSDKRQKLSNLLKNCRCPSGHRTMFYESNCHRWEATCFCRRTYCIYIDISFLNTKNINILNNIFRLCSWGLTYSEHVLLGKKQSRASVFLSLSESVSIFLILTTCFFWETMASFDIYVFIIAREISCKIGRSPYGVRLISYNAGRAPYDILRCPTGHRSMFSYTDDERRPYDMWPCKRKFVKNRPVPVLCQSVMSVLYVTIA